MGTFIPYHREGQVPISCRGVQFTKPHESRFAKPLCKRAAVPNNYHGYDARTRNPVERTDFVLIREESEASGLATGQTGKRSVSPGCLLFCVCGFRHGHPTNDAPIGAVFDPSMGDADGIGFTFVGFVRPSIRHPITDHAQFAGDLNGCSFEFLQLERKTFAGLRGDPVRNVILADGGGANGWPAEKIRVPQVAIAF